MALEVGSRLGDYNVTALIGEGGMGQVDAFRALAEEMSVATAKEQGVLNYEWSLSEDGKTCHILERYADSDGVRAHLDTFGSFADRFLGRQAIQAGWQANFAESAYDMTTEVDEIQVHGDWALMRGRDSGTRTPTDGEPLQETSKFMALHERQADGSWMITHDIWNSNDPAQ